MNLVDKVKEAGVIGAGGAGFPTHVKLQSKAELILLNGAECEPLLRVDQQLMEFCPEKIIAGLYMAGQQVEARKAIIGIKVKHKEVIRILRETIKNMDLEEKVSVHELPDIYPAGDEQVLVYEITGRVVPEGGIPLNVGCVVINTETALNVFNAAQDEPVTEKYVTIAGDVPSAVTVKVPVGTPLKELFEMAGIKDLKGFRVIDGGPMMGPLMADTDGFVTKKTKGLVVVREDHNLVEKKSKTMDSARRLNKSACEQCRMCTDMCPRHLLGHSTSPHKMVRAMAYSLEAGEPMTIAQTCCQCNLCEYFVCPAGINPKMANLFFINETRSKGMKHQPKAEYTPSSMREHRMIPSKRLMARIDVLRFDRPAPLDPDMVYNPEMVGISTHPHVGAPAEIVVSEGDRVTKGQKIARIPEGALGAAVHASIDGIVEKIDNGTIYIRRES